MPLTIFHLFLTVKIIHNVYKLLIHDLWFILDGYLPNIFFFQNRNKSVTESIVCYGPKIFQMKREETLVDFQLTSSAYNTNDVSVAQSSLFSQTVTWQRNTVLSPSSFFTLAQVYVCVHRLSSDFGVSLGL